MAVVDVIRVAVKAKEVCPVCLEEHCEVRITRNAIPSKADEQATITYRYRDIMGGKR